MVRKLMRYEILSYVRAMIPISMAVLGTAILAHFANALDGPSIPGEVTDLTEIVYLFVALGCFILTWIVGIVRFYKNMFTSEGYLTHTLPISPAAHIFVKLSAAILSQLFFAAVFILSTFICAINGKMFWYTELMVDVLDGFFGYEIDVREHIIPYVIFRIVAVAKNYLLFYGCLTLGQMFSKNRVMFSVGIYFAYCILSIAVYALVLADLRYTIIELLIMDLFDVLKMNFAHTLLLRTLWAANLGTCFFFVNHAVIKRRLNLE